MQNYENLIMELLDGDTPKEKYEYLKKLLKHLTMLLKEQKAFPELDGLNSGLDRIEGMCNNILRDK